MKGSIRERAKGKWEITINRVFGITDNMKSKYDIEGGKE